MTKSYVDLSILISNVILMVKHPRVRHTRYWLRHTARIPKGFLRYQVLKFLNVKAMSGSEIMDEIDNRTEWRPSPGSVYPLLSWLREKGFIVRVPSEEVGLKRFTLTNQGKVLLKEYEARTEFFRKRFFSMRRFWFSLIQDNISIYEANLRMIQAIEGLRPYIEKDENQEALVEAERILNEAATEIEGIKAKLEEKGNEE